MMKIGILLVLLLWNGCDRFSAPPGESTVVVDFSQRAPHLLPTDTLDSTQTLRLAISAMTSPKQTLRYYEELVHYISQQLNQQVKIVQSKTYQEVNEQLRDRLIDVAFICSGAFVEAQAQFPVELLAIPIIRGKGTYNAYIIVKSTSGIQRFEQLRGKTFAYTDPLSNSGRFYAEKRVRELNSQPEAFFSKIIYTYAHDYSIQAVLRGLVDGATVDGLIYEYLKQTAPEKVKNIDVIEISEDYGIPPIVVHRDLPATLKQQLRTIFFNMHLHPEGAKILGDLMIDRFGSGDAHAYDTIQKQIAVARP